MLIVIHYITTLQYLIHSFYLMVVIVVILTIHLLLPHFLLIRLLFDNSFDTFVVVTVLMPVLILFLR